MSESPQPDWSHLILSQLAAESKEDWRCTYDAEFISTYLDEHLHVVLAVHGDYIKTRNHFEAHLPHCPDCHTQLGHFDALREIYRHYTYRLEHQLTDWDICHAVLSTLHTQKKLPSVLPSISLRWPGVFSGSIAAVLIGLLCLLLPGQTTHLGFVNVVQLGEAFHNNPFSHLLAPPDVASVSYRSPEAYLFSRGTDAVTDDDLAHPTDASVIALATGQ